MSALAMAKVLGVDMERHPPVRVDDVACDWTARPADEERLAQTLALASEHGLVLIPFAGGTHAMLGNPPSRADVRLDLGALRGVLNELDLDVAGEKRVCKPAFGPLLRRRTAVAHVTV